MDLGEVLKALEGLPPDQRAQLEEQALDATGHLRWVPNPGPQTDAYFTDADELFYGGEAGGGKSDLIVGLALNEHRTAVIFRRKKDEARELGRRLCSLAGTNDGWNENVGIWRRPDKYFVFDGLLNEKDKEDHKGKARDLHAFDEICDFTESQYLFVTAWNRSAVLGQRCRIVCTGNPPTQATGLWVIARWAPWLDPRHPNPARDGELRWFLRGDDGYEREVDGAGPYEVGGKLVRAKSRTFIRARLDDNPDLARTDYDAQLAQLPEELRAAYRDGRFDASLKDQPNQLIPTRWVMDSQQRWTDRPTPGVPMCGMGVDPAEGGSDRYTIAMRYDGWYAQCVCIPGADIKLGSQGAGHVIANRRDNADIVLDMGGGYGGGTYQTLIENEIDVKIHKGANKSHARTADKKLGFVNKRSEVYWRFREALDPDQLGGSPIALPRDPEIISDLTVLTFAVTPNGIAVLPKEKVVQILQRSPDKGDAIVMAWSSGLRGVVPTHGKDQFGREQYIPLAGQRKGPGGGFKVNLGPRHSGPGRR